MLGVVVLGDALFDIAIETHDCGGVVAESGLLWPHVVFHRPATQLDDRPSAPVLIATILTQQTVPPNLVDATWSVSHRTDPYSHTFSSNRCLTTLAISPHVVDDSQVPPTAATSFTKFLPKLDYPEHQIFNMRRPVPMSAAARPAGIRKSLTRNPPSKKTMSLAPYIPHRAALVLVVILVIALALPSSPSHLESTCSFDD